MENSRTEAIDHVPEHLLAGLLQLVHDGVGVDDHGATFCESSRTRSSFPSRYRRSAPRGSRRHTIGDPRQRGMPDDPGILPKSLTHAPVRADGSLETDLQNHAVKTLHPHDQLDDVAREGTNAAPPTPATQPSGARDSGGRASTRPRAPATSPPTCSSHQHDRIAVFGPVITATRLATTAISLLLASDAIFAGDVGVRIATVDRGRLRHAPFASVRSDTPIRCPACSRSSSRSLSTSPWCLATGLWASPFVYTLLTAVIVAGFARGFGFGLRIGDRHLALDLVASADRRGTTRPTRSARPLAGRCC